MNYDVDTLRRFYGKRDPDDQVFVTFWYAPEGSSNDSRSEQVTLFIPDEMTASHVLSGLTGDSRVFAPFSGSLEWLEGLRVMTADREMGLKGPALLRIKATNGSLSLKSASLRHFISDCLSGEDREAPIRNRCATGLVMDSRKFPPSWWPFNWWPIRLQSYHAGKYVSVNIWDAPIQVVNGEHVVSLPFPL